ncbi:hypothetical protein FRAAL4212 [Frankia alni ACN14a]|uniref:Solute-binding protein family 5 domain-containing protein n=1 Tax=Frankia alni (strain DSM 45986 / CECT 9034 / ACN14a) TaxID=326424 RepID=Q0RI18_FRAAA|nr:hypothetical protein FRAAL4212 [Frankia alni ACN14a]
MLIEVAPLWVMPGRAPRSTGRTGPAAGAAATATPDDRTAPVTVAAAITVAAAATLIARTAPIDASRTVADPRHAIEYALKSGNHSSSRRRGSDAPTPAASAVRVAAVLLAGAGGASSSTTGTGTGGTNGAPTHGGTLTWVWSGTDAAIKDLSPYRTVADAGPQSGTDERFAIDDALIAFDTSGGLRNRIAKSLTTNDNVHGTLTLRDGVTFSDGTPFDAAAVQYNWQVDADPARGSAAAGYARRIASTSVVDARTLAVTLARPNTQFPRIVAQSVLSHVGSPSAMKKLGAAFGQTETDGRDAVPPHIAGFPRLSEPAGRRSKLGGRTRRGRGSAADDLAVDARAVVVVDREVPGGQVVPGHEVPGLPAEADGVVGRGGVRQQERQQGRALGRADAGQPQRRRAEEESLATGVAVGAHDRVLDGLGHRRPVVGPVARIGVVHGAHGFQQVLERLGQAVIGRLQIGPQRAPADVRDHLVGQRLQMERRGPPGAADVPGRGAPGLLQLEVVHQPVVLVAVQPLRVVEGLVEDPYCLHVRVGREVLVAEDEDLVLPERLAQGFGGGVVDATGQIDADDLGAEDGAGRADVVGRGTDSGHRDSLGVRGNSCRRGPRSGRGRGAGRCADRAGNAVRRTSRVRTVMAHANITSGARKPQSSPGPRTFLGHECATLSWSGSRQIPSALGRSGVRPRAARSTVAAAGRPGSRTSGRRRRPAAPAAGGQVRRESSALS